MSYKIRASLLGSLTEAKSRNAMFRNFNLNYVVKGRFYGHFKSNCLLQCSFRTSG